ncbi:MAG: prepilin-type N-terminal cleavage/methylation domain-containing protein, partial [Candidatus Eremiobacterota bacterium]
SKGFSIIEILVASFIGVILLGVVYLSYSNISSLYRIQKLETEFKQESTTAMQDITVNIQNSFTKGAFFYIDPNADPPTSFDVSPQLARKLYGTGTTNDTIGIFSSSKTKYQSNVLYKTYIRYGLKKLPKADPNFRGYALYKEVRGETGGDYYTGLTPVPAPDPNSSKCRTILGYYKNRNNYLAVSKIDFQLVGGDVVRITMQLVGAASRGAGTVTKAIYKPSKDTYYTTSVQIKVNSGTSGDPNS